MGHTRTRLGQSCDSLVRPVAGRSLLTGRVREQFAGVLRTRLWTVEDRVGVADRSYVRIRIVRGKANAVEMKRAFRANDPRPRRGYGGDSRVLWIQGVGLVLSKTDGLLTGSLLAGPFPSWRVTKWESLLSVTRLLRSKGIQSRVAVRGATLLPTDNRRIEICRNARSSRRICDRAHTTPRYA